MVTKTENSSVKFNKTISRAARAAFLMFITILIFSVHAAHADTFPVLHDNMHEFWGISKQTRGISTSGASAGIAAVTGETSVQGNRRDGQKSSQSALSKKSAAQNKELSVRKCPSWEHHAGL